MNIDVAVAVACRSAGAEAFVGIDIEEDICCWFSV